MRSALDAEFSVELPNTGYAQRLLEMKVCSSAERLGLGIC